MARLAFVALAVTCLSTLAAAGPNYLPGHDAEQARLMHRRAHGSPGYVSGDGGVHRKLARRSEGSRRASKRSCKASGSKPSSSSADSGGGSSPTATSSAASSSSTKTVGSSGDGGAGIVSSALSALVKETGITGFLKENSGIGSWFHTNSGTDSTNGHSWCGTQYQDSWPGFAPDVATMLDNFGGDYTKAATAYCGLEAIIKTPDGKTATGYIVDGFDPHWVRTPGSIDITYGFFATLYGSTTDNKDNVIQGIEWTLTGNRKTEYSFKGGQS